jgi:GntR family transcriptional regulator
MPFDVELDYDRGVPVYRQIYEAVARALASGRLAASEQLPTIHDLAARLEINPNTVVRAYKDLERDGHIVARRGKGTFTSPRPPGANASTSTQEAVLRGIYDRAMVEAAGHHISPKQVVRFFRKALHDE